MHYNIKGHVDNASDLYHFHKVIRNKNLLPKYSLFLPNSYNKEMTDEAPSLSNLPQISVNKINMSS